jgi:Icc-related predicted phosphoesterase
MIKSIEWLTEEFKPWAENLPVEKVFFIAGNHDFWFERNDIPAHKIFPQDQKVTYLKNELVEYTSSQDSKTYKIFGSPYCKIFGLWPFMRSADMLARKFNEIPENIDILFTHDAPYGTSDICLEGRAADGQHKGSLPLRDAVVKKCPEILLHGHLHSTNHEREMLYETEVFNTSILNEEYDIKYEPLIILI